MVVEKLVVFRSDNRVNQRHGHAVKFDGNSFMVAKLRYQMPVNGIDLKWDLEAYVTYCFDWWQVRHQRTDHNRG